MKRYVISFVSVMLSCILSCSLLIVPVYATASTPVCIILTHTLHYGSRDSHTKGDVSALQNFLIERGFLNGHSSGFYGWSTTQAVKRFQKRNKILSIGIIGPFSKAKIKSITCNLTTGNTTQSQSSIPHTSSTGIQTSVFSNVGPHLIQSVPSTTGNTYYVSPQGNDSNDGSQNNPLLTLQHAADIVKAGDTVIVRPGTYAGFVMGWDNPQNGTPDKPITFIADQGAIINSRNAKTPDGINLEGASYIIIDGFTLNGLPRAGIRSVTNTGVIIKNNTADNNGKWGIFTGFSENIDIEHNIVSHSQQQHGIYVSNSADNPIIRSNISFGNADGGIQINADGSEGGDGIITNALIEDNLIYDNGVKGGAAINLDGVQDSIIRNNVLYNNHASGIALFKIDGSDGPARDSIINNTIIMADNGRWALRLTSESGPIIVSNNILVNQNSRHGGISTNSAAEASMIQSDYNVFGSASNVATNEDPGTLYDLTSWQGLGHDTHSFVASPDSLFLNMATHNYHLSGSSPAIGKGTSVHAPSSDFDGTTRSQGSGYDIGAFEFH